MSVCFAAPVLDETSQRALDVHGYVVLPNLIDEAWRAALATRFDELAATEDGLGREISGYKGELGATSIGDLVNKGAVFDGVWQHPLVLAAVRHVLKHGFKLSSLNGREPRQGHGHQPLHVDAGPLPPGAPPIVCNSLWIIDGFDEANGGTRVVPCSHRLPGTPADHCQDPGAPHPDEIVLRQPPGTVVVFNAHLWHGGTINRNGHRRRVIHGYFTTRDQPQQSDQRALLHPETAARLSPAARTILDA